ncbi:uncharacterized protein TRIVIDRAFT_69293 [Trichoderma virens Gv29-8]|uniref:Transmembrane protein n=1 Tax=Hypocrea virens (strain Gv29-8 / FGSC 10586) TaxID=413071 RepID=G9N2I7_HYPVG|nr:uncharacterized protein TRIVIDRAFT_69293 [Trichoderma virens Gv29-8]EHK19297.1 hypothetical protein TRIVIDRAFT_69293 [Trichoderma virens Gv29-8]UKZ49248.1 hypothetical protein TrVGV298_003493 [Trichoderma virens]
MFRSRVRSRLLERYERQVCEKLCRQTANGCERSFASAQASTRNYATGKTVANANASRAVNKPAPGSTSSPRISSTTTTTTSAAAATKAAEAGALRTAEARDSALRAARMRRLAQQQDRLAEETKKKEEKREYKKRYDVAARKWVSTIIALPIFLVTSYYLFDRRESFPQQNDMMRVRCFADGRMKGVLEQETMAYYAFQRICTSVEQPHETVINMALHFDEAFDWLEIGASFVHP